MAHTLVWIEDDDVDMASSELGETPLVWKDAGSAEFDGKMWWRRSHARRATVCLPRLGWTVEFDGKMRCGARTRGGRRCVFHA
jgi:hypothetical protein